MTFDLASLTTKDFVAPFLGAFLSFFFMRITEAIREMNEILNTERKALTRLQRNMLVLIPRLHANIQVLDVYKSSLLALKQNLLFDNTPELLDVDIEIDHTEGMRNLDIINDTLQMSIYVCFNQKSLGELRDQMKKMWKEITDGLSDDNLPPQIAAKILRSSPNLLNSIEHLRESTLETIEIGKTIQAQIRIENRQFLFKNILYTAKRGTKAKRAKVIEIEREKMEQESKEILQKRSTKPIEGDQVMNAFGMHSN